MTVLDVHEPDEKPRVPLAQFSLEARPTPEDLQIWLSTDVRVAAEGRELFNDVYPMDEQLEPLAVFLPKTVAV